MNRIIVLFSIVFSSYSAYAATGGGVDDVVGAPQDQEICFSPDEQCDQKLINFMRTAKKSLDIAIFDLTLDGIVDQIKKMDKRVTVRIVCDKRQAGGKSSQIKDLAALGLQVKYGVQRGIMHNKFTIVDSKMVETGSYNYSQNATDNNHENQIYLSNQKVVTRYSEEFERMWADGVPVQAE